VKAEVGQHLDRAEELLRAARGILQLGFPSDSVSRSYYAMFHAATAALLELGIQRSSHHGVWAAFGQFIAAPGLMDVRYHRTGLELFAARSRSEYRAKPDDTPEGADGDLATARDFVAACRRFLETQDESG
jgi:uncharacterized protein (UPF0332 family)